MAKKETGKVKSKKEKVKNSDVGDNKAETLTSEGVEAPIGSVWKEKDIKKPKRKETRKKTTSNVAKATKSSANKESKLPKAEKKRSKKYRKVATLVDKNNYYALEEGIRLVKKTSTTKFDASVEIHIRLGVDPSSSDQQVRGIVTLPEGTGKTKKVAVICSTDKEKEAKDAGADKVGGDSLILEIEKGKLDFDVLVATPDMMAKIGKLGKVLGTKGLMPNPKAGTVTSNVGKTVKGLKTGMVEFRTDKNGIIHQVIGKVSFDEKKIEANYNEFIDAIKHAKPSGAKGTYLRSITLTTTMGPGIKIAV